MSKEKKSFSEKMKTVFFVAVSTLPIIISFLGYSLNKNIEVRNQKDYSVQLALHNKEFWQEIENVESDIYIQTGVIAENVVNFLEAASAVLDEVEKISFLKKNTDISTRNITLPESYTNLVTTFVALRGSVSTISLKHNNSVLIYNNLTTELGIEGWEEYKSLSEELNSWKIEYMEVYQEIFDLSHSIAKTQKIPNDLEQKMVAFSKHSGMTTLNIAHPLVNGIAKLKKQNL